MFFVHIESSMNAKFSTIRPILFSISHSHFLSIFRICRMSQKKRIKSSTSASTVKLSEPLNQCLAILKVIMAKNDAVAFLEPVDWQGFGLTDYPEIIKHPMDLGTIQVRPLSMWRVRESHHGFLLPSMLPHGSLARCDFSICNKTFINILAVLCVVCRFFFTRIFFLYNHVHAHMITPSLSIL